MEKHPVEKPLLSLPRIGLGGTLFGREIDEHASCGIMDYALSKGINLLDTAEAYGGGNARLQRKQAYNTDDVREASDEMHSSEKIIGRWMRACKNRRDVIVCTKFGPSAAPDQVTRSLAASLDRLQTDYADIYMFHWWASDIPLRETMEALTAEVRAGRIRSVGGSNFPLARLKEANELAAKFGLVRLNSVQPAFSLAAPSIQNDLLPYCQRERIAVMTYSPLAAGFLTGKYSPGGSFPKGTRFHISPAHADVYFSDRNFHVVNRLRELSAETGISMAKLAMTWVFQQPGVSCVLVGARDRAQLDNAIAAQASPLPAALKKRMSSWLTEPISTTPAGSHR